MKSLPLPFLCALLAVAYSPRLFAAQAGDFDYPELLVTPRASERLTSEAAKEPSTRWTSELPLQVSALSTVAAGIAQLSNPDPSKDANGVTGVAGVAVGGAWLLASVAIEAMYQPYASAARESAAMRAKTPREQLVRERASEEAIESASRMACRIKYLSVVTNLGSNVYMLSQAKSSSFSQVMDGVAAAFSLAPLIFRPHWQDVADEQDSYKKRIFAPIASATLFREPATGTLIPGAAITMSF